MHRNAIRAIFSAAAMLLIATACPSRGPARGRTEAKETPNIVQLRTKTLQDAEQKRKEWQDKLKSMDTSQLAAALTSESERGLEPFNSMAFAEAVARGETAAPALAGSIARTDRSSLLTLLAVRRASTVAYNSIDPTKRVAILVESLRTSKSFNTWGLPHVRWEYAAESLIAEGAQADKPLSVLLEDRRPAEVWGSEDYLEYVRYKYRVCDYAWVMLAQIRKQKIDLSADPAVRDRQITLFKVQHG